MIRDEIKDLMTEFHSVNGNEISAKFAFPESFTGFSGHFPNNPVLPGICQIQCILAALSVKHKKVLKLKSVSRAKFLNPVFPGEKILLTGKIDHKANPVIGKFKITKQSGEELINISRISLECF